MPAAFPTTRLHVSVLHAASRYFTDLVRLERGAPGASGPHAHLHGRRPKVGHRGRCCLHALPLRCVWQANFPHGTGARATSGSAVCYRWQSRRRMGADGWAAATRSGERLSPPGADTGSGECASASLRLRCGARPPVAAQVAVPRGPLVRVRASAEWSKSCVEVKIAKNFPPPAGASGGACGELPPTILPVYITAGRRRPESSPKMARGSRAACMAWQIKACAENGVLHHLRDGCTRREACSQQGRVA